MAGRSDFVYVADSKLCSHENAALRDRIVSPRARIRGASRIDLEVEKILEHYHLRRYVKVSRNLAGARCLGWAAGAAKGSRCSPTRMRVRESVDTVK
ncbi:MAG: hypothetical protein ACREUL_15580 [Steroidobacteraceae bacterium]